MPSSPSSPTLAQPAQLEPPAPSSPPSPPPLLPSQSAAHSQHLSSLAQRSAALDLRAQTLTATEATLAAQISDYTSRLLSLEKLETSIRRETSSLLDALSARQNTLADREREHEDRENALSSRLRSLRSTLRASKRVEADLSNRKARLQDVQREYDTVSVQVQSLEKRKDEAEKAVQDEEKRREEIEKEVSKMRDVLNRAERAEREVREREKRVAEMETRVTVREEAVERAEGRISRYRELEVALGSIKAFAAEAGVVVGVRVDVQGEVGEVVEGVTNVVRELGGALREVRVGREEVERRYAEVKMRDKEVGKGERKLKTRERSVTLAEGRLKEAGEDLKRLERKVEESWRAVEEARAELEAREEQTRMREEEERRREERRRYKEKAIEQQERMLLRRERSVRRAHAAVAEKEREIERRAKDVEAEKEGLKNLKATVDLKEDLLETRELELATREGKKSKRLEVLLEKSLERRRAGNLSDNDSQDHREMGEKGTGAGFATARGSVHAADVRGGGGMHLNTEARPDTMIETPATAHNITHVDRSGNVQTAQQPATVRRQLAFEAATSSRNQNTGRDARDISTGTGTQRTRNMGILATSGVDVGGPSNVVSNMNDDVESEAAADELLPELVGARALWKERILRLEAVVENMQENTRNAKPHVQPVLTGVSSQLRGLRQNIDESPAKSFESSKMSYAAERSRQLEWGVQMREQLEAVRDVQAGMLIALNREEDDRLLPLEEGTLPTAVETEERPDETADGDSVTETSSTSQSASASTRGGMEIGGEESSADATVDATRLNMRVNDGNDTTDGLEMSSVSFDRFRQQVHEWRKRESRADTTLPENDDMDFSWNKISERSMGSANESTNNGENIDVDVTTSTDLVSIPPQSANASLLRELATIRNELETISRDAPTT